MVTMAKYFKDLLRQLAKVSHGLPFSPRRIRAPEQNGLGICVVDNQCASLEGSEFANICVYIYIYVCIHISVQNGKRYIANAEQRRKIIAVAPTRGVSDHRKSTSSRPCDLRHPPKARWLA